MGSHYEACLVSQILKPVDTQPISRLGGVRSRRESLVEVIHAVLLMILASALFAFPKALLLMLIFLAFMNLTQFEGIQLLWDWSSSEGLGGRRLLTLCVLADGGSVFFPLFPPTFYI